MGCTAHILKYSRVEFFLLQVLWTGLFQSKCGNNNKLSFHKYTCGTIDTGCAESWMWMTKYFERPWYLNEKETLIVFPQFTPKTYLHLARGIKCLTLSCFWEWVGWFRASPSPTQGVNPIWSSSVKPTVLKDCLHPTVRNSWGQVIIFSSASSLQLNEVRSVRMKVVQVQMRSPLRFTGEIYTLFLWINGYALRKARVLHNQRYDIINFLNCIY